MRALRTVANTGHGLMNEVLHVISHLKKHQKHQYRLSQLLSEALRKGEKHRS